MGKSSIEISHDRSALCEEILFIEPGLQSYSEGEIITLSDERLNRDRQVFVTGVNYNEDATTGKATIVTGFSKEYLYAKKAPSVTVTFMTLTPEELSEFWELNEYSKMEYRPLILTGDRYGCGGWTLHLVIAKLVEWMGITDEEGKPNIVINLPNYEIKNFTIEPYTTFFEAIQSLVSAFTPIILLESDILYILERGCVGMLDAGGWNISPGKSRVFVSNEYVPEPGCLLVQGQHGRYHASKDPTAHKRVCVNRCEGKPKEYSKLTLLSDGSQEHVTVKDIYYEDQYNRDWALKSSTKTVTRTFPAESGLDPITTKTVRTITYYDGENDPSGAKREPDTLRCFEYETPIEWSATTQVYQDFGCAWGMALLEEIVDNFRYNDDWTLASQVSNRKALFVEEGGGYVEFDNSKHVLEDYFDAFGNINDNAVFRLSETTEITYEPLTRNSYGVHRVVSRYAWNGDEWIANTESDSQIVQAGGTQQNKPRLRLMPVYAGNCPVFAANVDDESLIMEEKAKLVSIPTPSWSSIEECHAFVSALYLQKYRTLEADVFNIDPILYLTIGNLGSFAEGGIDGKYYTTGYRIRISGETGTEITLMCEARVAE